jgi:hypothetical protein
MQDTTTTQNPMARVMGIRDFRILFAGTATSLRGDQFALVATPWLTLQLTDAHSRWKSSCASRYSTRLVRLHAIGNHIGLLPYNTKTPAPFLRERFVCPTVYC